MKNTFKIALLSGVILFSAPSFAEEFSAKQKDEIGQLVKEYLLDNPSVIFEAVAVHEQNQREAAKKQANEKIEENFAYLTRSDAPSIGNPDGDVTIVEFFDYNCGYCKRALPDLQKVVADDPNVRVVFKEVPILGPTSRTAALWALAAKQQGQYFEYHSALMKHRGPKEEKELEKIAKKLGLDVDQMKKDVKSEDVVGHLAQDVKVSQDIGVQGTPAFIVGKTFIPGYVGVDGLKEAIKEERNKAKKDS